MPRIAYGSSRWDVEQGQNLLDALLERGVRVSHGCRSGVCRSCTMVALEGPVPPASQAELSHAEKKQGLFLPCQCVVADDLVIADVGDRLEVDATIEAVERLSERVTRLRLRPHGPMDFIPGQFATMIRPEGLARSYSIASRPGDPWIEFHIGLVEGGRMSRWAHEEARRGDPVKLRGPYGRCCYDPQAGGLDEPLLLVGVGTGLAPLWGIVHDAIAAGHRGPIFVHHGARVFDGLYLHRELEQLARERDNVTYRAHVLEGPAGTARQGALDLAALKAEIAGEFADYRVFLCGAPDFVNGMRKRLFIGGCTLAKIHADAFVTAPKTTENP